MIRYHVGVAELFQWTKAEQHMRDEAKEHQDISKLGLYQGVRPTSDVVLNDES